MVAMFPCRSKQEWRQRHGEEFAAYAFSSRRHDMVAAAQELKASAAIWTKGKIVWQLALGLFAGTWHPLRMLPMQLISSNNRVTHVVVLTAAASAAAKSMTS